ncbi:MAG: EsaB/YukD family protein [archaeon]|nr:EsaB/YukD family protein [archaeon]
MSLKLNVLNATENTTISVEADESDSVGDIIVFATQYWNKQQQAFVMKMGSRLIPPDRTMAEMGLKDGDTIVLVPDPQGG